MSAPFSIKYLTTSKSPFHEAHIKAVLPSSFLALTSAPFSIKSFTTSKKQSENAKKLYKQTRVERAQGGNL